LLTGSGCMPRDWLGVALWLAQRGRLPTGLEG
jgi:hypothetical protein